MGVTILPKKFYDALDFQNVLLASIASNMGDKGITITNWQDVQRVVRMGIADKMFKVGDQFVSSYDTGQIVWDVIGINHDTPTDKKYSNSLTLQAHDCILNVQFDAPEALYYAEEELPAGEQVFTLNSIKYTFTTTKAVPAGGQVYINAWETQGYAPTAITTYAADRTTAIETGLPVTVVELGDDTLSPVNDYTRCIGGSSNYVESAIKQWLNSDADTFAWVPKTNYDRTPTSALPSAGFLKLLDPELTAVLGAVDKQVARNTVTDGGGQDLFSDKVFLLSFVEVFGGTEGTTTGEQAYPYYSTLAANPTADALAVRIKYLDSSACSWWLRSPLAGYVSNPRYVYPSGAVYHNYARQAIGAAPACCIV